MKQIHTLFILDRSGSMLNFKGQTLESLNSNLATLREEAKKNGVKAFNTLQTFASTNSFQSNNETDFLYPRLLVDVDFISDLTATEYCPAGGTPLLDAIGNGIETLKTNLGDAIGSEDVSILVTIFTDGEENTSKTYKKEQIKKMIDHLSSDNKWTFTFVGCGSLDNVTATSGQLGIDSSNTVAFDSSDLGYKGALKSCATSYGNYLSATVSGGDTRNLFAEKP